MKKVTTVVLAALLAVGISALAFMANMGDKAFALETHTVGTNVEIMLNASDNSSSELLPGVSVNKKVSISLESGSKPAWVWLTYTVPAVLDMDSVLAVSAQVGEGWTIYNDSIGTVTEEGVTYNVHTLLYSSPLNDADAPTSEISLGVTMNSSIDINEDGNWVSVVNGEEYPIQWNSDSMPSVKIKIDAYAIQTDGFQTVDAAYSAYNSGNSSTENTAE